MAGKPWQDDEVADAVALTWPEFHAKHQGRTWEGWRYKRRNLLDGRHKVPAQAEIQLEKADPEALLMAAVAMQKELDKLWQACEDLPVRVETDEPIGVVFLADAHIGEAGTDIERLHEDVQIIAEHPQLYVYLGGDMAHNFILNVMTHFGTLDDSMLPIQAQWELVRWFVRRLQGSIIAMGVGNHDWWTRRVVGIDRAQEIAEQYHLIYTGHGGLVRLTVGKQLYRIYRRHKYRFNSSFNLTHTVKRLWEHGPTDFDVGVVEHGHQPAIETFLKRNRLKVAIRTGTYLTESAFAAEVGANWQYGTPVVVFHPDQFRLTPFFSLEEAMAHLG